MQLYFLGVSYEYYEYHLSQREVTPQSVQMLRYRGVPYMRESQSSRPRRTSAEVTPQPVQMLRYRGVPYMQVSHLAPDELALK